MKKIHIGCSSYQNHAWVELFYPAGLPSKEWFTFYCRHFNTFEINSTFYKFPTERVMHNWYKKAPGGFLYAVKAPKVITHEKRLIDSGTELQQFYEICRQGLREKLGCIRFQFPPSFTYSDERLDLLLQLLDPGFKNAVEFRHESWWRVDVLQSFDSHRISFCSVSYPTLPDDFVATGRTGYVRFHGKQRLFYSGYRTEELATFYDQLSSCRDTDEIYVYFNNTAGKEGIRDALALSDIAVESAKAAVQYNK